MFLTVIELGEAPEPDDVPVLGVEEAGVSLGLVRVELGADMELAAGVPNCSPATTLEGGPPAITDGLTTAAAEVAVL